MLELKQGDGGKLTGAYIGSYGTFPVTGTIKNGRIQFSFAMHPNGETAEMVFTGEVSADGQSMKGTANMAQLGEAEWSARRDREKK
jgi:hypothetical protein